MLSSTDGSCWPSRAEEVDAGNLEELLAELRDITTGLVPPTAFADLRSMSGRPLLLLEGNANRRRGESRDVGRRFDPFLSPRQPVIEDMVRASTPT